MSSREEALLTGDTHMNIKQQVVQEIIRAAEKLADGSAETDPVYDATEAAMKKMLKEPWAIQEIEKALRREMKAVIRDSVWVTDLLMGVIDQREFVKALKERVKLVIE